VRFTRQKSNLGKRNSEPKGIRVQLWEDLERVSLTVGPELYSTYRATVEELGVGELLTSDRMLRRASHGVPVTAPVLGKAQQLVSHLRLKHVVGASTTAAFHLSRTDHRPDGVCCSPRRYTHLPVKSDTWESA
jgi:hypothetical protein